MPIEQIQAIDVSPDVRRRSIIYGFTWLAIFESEILSDDACYYAAELADSANHDDTWDTGEKITFDDRQNIAAMQTLQTLPTLLSPNKQLFIPRFVQGAEGVYANTEQRLATLGYPTTPKYNRAIVEITKLPIRLDFPTEDPYAAILQNTWNARGLMEQEYFVTDPDDQPDWTPAEGSAPDYFLTDNNGGLIEARQQPKPPTYKKLVPYYQHVPSEQGYHAFLSAYLDDVCEINTQILALDSVKS